MSVARCAPAVALALALASACVDAGHSIELHNATGVPIEVTITGAHRTEPLVVTRGLAPGETLSQFWTKPFGNNPPATVRAEDPRGTLLYCRRFTYADIKPIPFRIEIVSGEIHC